MIADDRAVDPQQALEAQLLHEEVGQLLGTLAPRPRSVLELRFGLRDGRPRTLEQIGGELGLTHERVRQIEVRALRALRWGLSESGPKTLDSVGHLSA